MGLGNTSNRIYLGISDGKLVRRVTADTPKAQSRMTKDGKVVYELRYSFLKAVLTGISIRRSQYAGQEFKEWIFELTDGKENFQLQIMYDSRYATSLLFAMANPIVDFSKPITITPWMKVVNDKKKTACYLQQDGEGIEWFFTKENPNGMPDLEKVMYQGKERWDSYNRMQFLEKYVETKIKPQLSSLPVTPAAEEDHWTAGPFPENNTGSNTIPDEDDLPF